jgi:putative ABC transport system ATP-binding protein
MQHHAPAPAARAFERFDQTAVRAERAVKVYGKGETQVRALDGVDVAIPAARWTVIMGPSGSGKSTLMHCLAGLDTLTSGRVILDGVDLRTLSDKQRTKLRREKIGFVFQSFNLIPTLSALENIVLPASLGGRKPDADVLGAVVDAVGLGNRLTHRPSELSGGQQQRVAIARALVGRPAVVFADEPTGNLDSRSGTEVLSLLRHAVDTMQQTVVMVTHDAAAAAHADEVLFLVDGRITDAMREPTADRVLVRLHAFGSGAEPTGSGDAVA